MLTDPIADLLTRIRNAQLAGHPAVTVPFSKNKERVVNVLCDEGYVAGVEKIDSADGKPELKVHLKYYGANMPVIKELRRISRPGKRVYVRKDQIPVYKGGLGITVVSTSKGMLSDKAARTEGLGGELICAVF